MADTLGPVATALESDLAAIADLGEKGQALVDGALAGLAREMARQLDWPKNSATSKAMCAGRLTDALAQLRALAPAEEEGDGLDDLKSKPDDRGAATPD